MLKPTMANPADGVAPILSPSRRYLSAGAVAIVFVLLLVGALAIPFIFESPSMWYKFGIAKVSLRTGKMVGMAAGLLILIQLPLAGRSVMLDRIFSLPAVMRQHRIHAWVIVLLALLHPLCVLLAEGTLFVPLEMRYWPEWVGVGLLVAILTQFILSTWRQKLGVAFFRWMAIHRIIGLLLAILLVVHVLYVSESFSDEGPPRWAVWIAAGLFLVHWLWLRTGWLRARRSAFSVSRIEPAASDCTSVELTPEQPAAFRYVPGQFAFVTFRSGAVSPEPHVFTLSSTPSRPQALQFTIRSCGDWTQNVKRLSIGDKAFIQGPFGRFGHLFAGSNRELIMIAGGVGITPMLSMLRFMADRNDQRPITLIWSNRSPETVVFTGEMDALAAQLTALRHVPIFTRIKVNGKRTGRLDRKVLKTILDGCSRKATVFICGPPQMMQQVKADLKALGFSSRLIFTEAFGF